MGEWRREGVCEGSTNGTAVEYGLRLRRVSIYVLYPVFGGSVILTGARHGVALDSSTAHIKPYITIITKITIFV